MLDKLNTLVLLVLKSSIKHKVKLSPSLKLPTPITLLFILTYAIIHKNLNSVNKKTEQN